MKTTVLVMVISLSLTALLLSAGCMQGSGNAVQPSSVSPAPESDQGSAVSGTGDDGQALSPSANGAGTGAQHQYRAGGITSNATRITAAAEKLGVSEDTLRQALNSNAGERPDLAAAAQQLGVTQQQLTDALGVPAGSFQGRHMNTTTTAAP